MSVSSLIFYEKKKKKFKMFCSLVSNGDYLLPGNIYVEDHRGVHSRELKMLYQEFEVSGFHNKIITLI